jgi:hypothetical protein
MTIECTHNPERDGLSEFRKSWDAFRKREREREREREQLQVTRRSQPEGEDEGM